MAEATRDPVTWRYDLLLPGFLREMALTLGTGAVKYGEDNWKKGLPGAKSPVNHALAHVIGYMEDPNAPLDVRIENLTHAAVNLMFEYHFLMERWQKGLEAPNGLDTHGSA